jgi:hypothetical protein
MVSAVSTVGAKLSGGGGWAQALLGVVGAVGLRPLWASLALAALRAVRRHPIATIAGAAGAFALVAWWRGRRARA